MSLFGFQMADIFTWQVAVWVIIILITGFIGQFGKSFAQYIISWFNRRKMRETAPVVSGSPVSAPSASVHPVSTPPGKSFPPPASLEQAAADEAKIRKKEAKVLTKAKKKELKQKKKS